MLYGETYSLIFFLKRTIPYLCEFLNVYVSISKLKQVISELLNCIKYGSNP